MNECPDCGDSLSTDLDGYFVCHSCGWDEADSYDYDDYDYEDDLDE